MFMLKEIFQFENKTKGLFGNKYMDQKIINKSYGNREVLLFVSIKQLNFREENGFVEQGGVYLFIKD